MNPDFFTEFELSLPIGIRQPVAADAGYEILRCLGEVADKLLHDVLLKFEPTQTVLSPDTSHDEIIAALTRPGMVVQFAELKQERRATEKVETLYRGDWRKLGDMVRASIGFDSLHEIRAFLSTLRTSSIELARRPIDRMFAMPDEAGYRDLLLNLRMANGMIVELQIHLKAILLAKREAHKHYEVMRDIKRNMAKEKRMRMTRTEMSAYQTALRAQRRLYGAAWVKALGSADRSSETGQGA